MVLWFIVVRRIRLRLLGFAISLGLKIRMRWLFLFLWVLMLLLRRYLLSMAWISGFMRISWVGRHLRRCGRRRRIFWVIIGLRMLMIGWCRLRRLLRWLMSCNVNMNGYGRLHGLDCAVFCGIWGWVIWDRVGDVRGRRWRIIVLEDKIWGKRILIKLLI